MSITKDIYLSSIVITAIEQNKIPRYLYKYRRIPETKIILKDGTVYFSKLTQFNDPFEGIANIEQDYTRNQWYNFLINNNVKPNDASTKAKELITIYNADGKTIVETAINNCLSKLGFYCLAKEPDNLLMWAHYADNHQGCVIEFDLLKCLPIFEKIGAVNYSGKYMSYNYLVDQSGPYKTIFHKSKEWKYEKEYRIMNTQKCGVIQLPVDAVSSIIFGYKTSKRSKNAIKKLIPLSLFPNAITKQVVLNSSQYKLDIIDTI